MVRQRNVRVLNLGEEEFLEAGRQVGRQASRQAGKYTFEAGPDRWN